MAAPSPRCVWRRRAPWRPPTSLRARRSAARCPARTARLIARNATDDRRTAGQGRDLVSDRCSTKRRSSWPPSGTARSGGAGATSEQGRRRRLGGRRRPGLGHAAAPRPRRRIEQVLESGSSSNTKSKRARTAPPPASSPVRSRRRGLGSGTRRRPAPRAPPRRATPAGARAPARRCDRSWARPGVGRDVGVGGLLLAILRTPLGGTQVGQEVRRRAERQPHRAPRVRTAYHQQAGSALASEACGAARRPARGSRGRAARRMLQHQRLQQELRRRVRCRGPPDRRADRGRPASPGRCYPRAPPKSSTTR